MEEMGRTCYECRYYGKRTGNCINPCSERFEADVAELEACDEFAEVATVSMTSDDLEPVKFAFNYTCPYCGSLEREYEYSTVFHERFMCSDCGKMVDIDCDE